MGPSPRLAVVGDADVAPEVAEQVEIQARYAGYITRQQDEVERARRQEETQLPDGFDFAAVSGLSNEVRQRLGKCGPRPWARRRASPGSRRRRSLCCSCTSRNVQLPLRPQDRLRPGREPSPLSPGVPGFPRLVDAGAVLALADVFRPRWRLLGLRGRGRSPGLRAHAVPPDTLALAARGVRGAGGHGLGRVSFSCTQRDPQHPQPGAGPWRVFHDFSVKTIDGQPKSLKDYQGKPVLLVNVASACGLTPQYAGLEKLFREYKDQGLVVLGLPCNQFGAQEPGSEAEIKQFCSLNYDVSFPLTVQDRGERRRRPSAVCLAQGETGGADIQWNFEKFLIGKDGHVIKRYSPKTVPEDKHCAATSRPRCRRSHDLSPGVGMKRFLLLLC